MLPSIRISDFETVQKQRLAPFPLTYEAFGQPLGSAPLILVGQALTANSTLVGEKGWWEPIVGPQKAIDTDRASVLCFNIPGNGYDGFFFDNEDYLTATDIARIFILGLKALDISEVALFVAGSIGGGIAWSMIAQNEVRFKRFVPIATDWKSTDWVIAHCHIQERLLQEETEWGLKLARQHAMLTYRTPQSFDTRFQRERKSSKYAVESWLDYHGDALSARFHAKAYRHLNRILRQIDTVPEGQTFESVFALVQTEFFVVSITSDLLFIPTEDDKTVNALRALGKPTDHFKIYSLHGHDAFLIEHDQVAAVIKGIWSQAKELREA
jgi:homoserine O-acetyltransferase